MPLGLQDVTWCVSVNKPVGAVVAVLIYTPVLGRFRVLLGVCVGTSDKNSACKDPLLLTAPPFLYLLRE